jgi:hypothetical protein
MITPTALGIRCRMMIRRCGPQRQHLAADQPGRGEPGQQRQQADDHQQVRRDHVHQDQQQQQAGNGQERVDDAHHDRVDQAAGQPGDRAPGRADDRGGDAHRQAQFQRRLAAQHEPAKDVVAGAVGSQRMPGAGPQRGEVQHHGDLVGVVDQRPGEAEQGDEDDQPDAHDGLPALGERRQDAPPGRALDRDLAGQWPLRDTRLDRHNRAGDAPPCLTRRHSAPGDRGRRRRCRPAGSRRPKPPRRRGRIPAARGSRGWWRPARTTGPCRGS